MAYNVLQSFFLPRDKKLNEIALLTINCKPVG